MQNYDIERGMWLMEQSTCLKALCADCGSCFASHYLHNIPVCFYVPWKQSYTCTILSKEFCRVGISYEMFENTGDMYYSFCNNSDVYANDLKTNL